jgi:hypothetical protein
MNSQPDPLSDEELARLELLCGAATPGPWTSSLEGRDHWAGSHFVMTPNGDIELSSGARDADYDFIAAARTLMPRLLHELRALRARP